MERVTLAERISQRLAYSSALACDGGGICLAACSKSCAFIWFFTMTSYAAVIDFEPAAGGYSGKQAIGLSGHLRVVAPAVRKGMTFLLPVCFPPRYCPD